MISQFISGIVEDVVDGCKLAFKGDIVIIVQWITSAYPAPIEASALV